MNLSQMKEAVWRMVGKNDSSQRMACDHQEITDAINHAQILVAQELPHLGTLQREGTLSLTPGTNTYHLNDWCAYPLAFKVVNADGVREWPVGALNPLRGYRECAVLSAQGIDGPWEFITGPRSTETLHTNTVSTVAEAATTLTLISATATSVLIGRMLNFQGESGDYRVTAVGSTTSITLDRPVRAPVAGRSPSATGAGSGYASGTEIKIGPAGGFQIITKPTPSVAATWKYIYIASPRWLLSLTDVPEVPREHHQAIVAKAAAQYLAYQGNTDKAAAYEGRYAEAADKLKKRHDDNAPDTRPVGYAQCAWGSGRSRRRNQWGPFTPGTDLGRW